MQKHCSREHPGSKEALVGGVGLILACEQGQGAEVPGSTEMRLEAVHRIVLLID